MTKLSQETTDLVRGSEGRGAGVSFPEEVGIGVDAELLMENNVYLFKAESSKGKTTPQ